MSLAPPEQVAGLPEPRQAVATAERYLRAAAAIRSGAALGYTLKALAQALQQNEFLGTPAEPGAVARLCDEALRLIPADDVTARAAVSAMWAAGRG